jgi:hypothetical protein
VLLDTPHPHQQEGTPHASVFPILAAAFTVAAAPSHAELRCFPRADILTFLADQHGESRQTIGMDGQGSVVEMFANVESGTWTLVVTFPDGRTCVVTSGTHFEWIDAEPEPAGIRS